MRNVLFLVLVPALSMSAACFTTEESFPDQVVAATCQMTYNCYKASFLSEWDDMEDCADELEEQFDEVDDCDFDDDNASKCLASMQKYASTCDEDDAEEAYDDCNDVYDDC